ncbi:MAG: DUF3656 domain-containing protein [Prevotella sp.]|nr:DUF3656 domain-containing protein [Prevotella sp.]
MRELELLVPAKDLACGIAAVDHGADAVYIGPERFGARVAAGNSVDDIRQLCEYAHRFAVKVFVTVNTLLRDDELDNARRLIWQLYEAGADAILVQDMRVLDMALPPIALHASTQTDNRTADKVQCLQQAGFRRVVLARELSSAEIADIHAAVPDMPLEVFVHGALCVSYSGCCYASEFCFGRSANRGACAQFCRLPFDLIDADGTVVEHERYLLSLKDLNQSSHLQELVDAGASSFKVEGRLKDVAYVKNVTAAYSQLLDDIVRRQPDQYRRASLGHCTYTFSPNLDKTFNRGYTSYFLHGRQPDMASFDTPKAVGEFVGMVKELRDHSFVVASSVSFANGDGLCFFADGLQGFRVNRVVPIPSAAHRRAADDGQTYLLFPYQVPRGLRPGMRLYRNNDMEFERLLSKQSSERKIPVQLRLDVTPTGFSLASGGVVASVEWEHQLAEKPQRDNIVRQLGKLGGTAYACTDIVLPDGFNYFIPSSLLSELRRRLVKALDESVQQLVVSSREPDRADKVSGRIDMTDMPNGTYTSGSSVPLMQCRHCLRYALGYCTRRGGKRPTWREPLSLRLSDGRSFPLEFDCKHCQMNVWEKSLHALRTLALFCILLLLPTSCYNHGQQTPDVWDLTKEQLDSISFFTTHHYTQGYNFVVKADSLVLHEMPIMPDSFSVPRSALLVVADIDILPQDTIDSVWVKVARDQLTQGWIRESEMLRSVSPDDSISQFIDFFSDSHLLIFMSFIVVVGVAYVIYRLQRRNAYIVHFRDTGSFYPTLLCLLVAASATLYASIQMFGPETWRHFYYHPSLNPFSLPTHLAVFIMSVWAILIIGIAAVDDTLRRLPLGDAVLYLGGLAGICAVCYVVFSITTLYYIGYPLLVAYVVFALWRYACFSRRRFVCGHCGQPLRDKGICPHCGALNE